jgi:hypothetical protein
MKVRSQRGQALPAVLAIMLVLVLLAGGATMAVSAVLRQQDANRALTNADLASQNAVAATAANINSGKSACQPATTSGPPDSLLHDDFKPGNPFVTGQNGVWRFLAGSGGVQPNGLVLAPSSVIVPNLSNLKLKGPETWSDYSVSVQLRPTSTSGIGPELDAYSHESPTHNSLTSRYFLQLNDGDAWTFGMTTVSKSVVKISTFRKSAQSQSPFTYDTTHPTKLELDLFGDEITAKIDDAVVGHHADPTIPAGSIAIVSGASPLEVDNVHVDQPVPPPTPQVDLVAPPPFPSAGIPDKFYCQRLESITTGTVSQQRVAISAPSSCIDLGAPIALPDGVAGHVKIWFIVPWPAGAQGSVPQGTPGVVPSVALGGCPKPNDIEVTDCGRQRSTLVPGSTLMVIGADCANRGPTQKSGTYDVFLSLPTTYKGNPVIDLRSAPSPGNGSLYMSVMAVKSARGRSYVVSDFLMPGGVLSYEGMLG